MPVFLDLPERVTPENPCLNCGKLLDRATPVNDPDAKPHEGAISICFACGHVMQFDAHGKFVPLSDEAALAIAGDPDFLRIANARGAAWRAYQKSKAKRTNRDQSENGTATLVGRPCQTAKS
jgi:hypothetical protein